MKVQKWIQDHSNHITVLSAILIALGFVGKIAGVILLYKIALAVASIIAVIPIAIHAYQAVKVKVISIDLLVTIAVIGAFIIGEYNESAIVTFLFLFGSYLEQKTLTKTRESIKALTEMAPTTASVLQADGTTEEVTIDDVEEGDVVLVKTGGAIPVDGQVVDGKGYADEAAVTGESKQVVKTTGDEVFSGTILADGFLKIEATKVGDDTTFAKIIELVEEAQDTKSHAEKFIDRFSQYYTPAVLFIALIVGLISRDFRLAITVLVLGCPGALVIGAPVSNVAGIGNGAKRGILVKGGEAMDTFSKIDTFVFDKTGTLTKGTTAVSTIKNYTTDEKLSLALVARLEMLSDHPLGRAVINYATEKKLTFQQLTIQNNQTIKGQGIVAEIDGHEVCAGNAKLIATHNLSLTPQQEQDLLQLQKNGSSIIIVVIDKKITQIIGVSDIIRPEVAEQLARLKQAGAKHLVMLTGDNQITAEYVANVLGIDEVHAELLPDEKVQFVKKFQDQGRRVAFVGDGINDSPSLATADIGIAMGSGTDVAIETSDVVLMQSSFEALVHAYRLAKKTVLNTRENVVIAIGVVLFLLIGLFAGFIYMASGMFVHEASILVVIFNAMRLLYFGHKK
ncbi:heavy metal translocating P-type ATPase [Enterococcus dongliensis]|uniref:Cd(2+)-exporting ATPase n=1 Tax=Enterococcus dongliensis TaxID=2559925 RepID=A0AAW8TIE1_9ENTE|nr:heavy metal translocating P-type ATPase [Enterococcus dongliensis]MDT2604392.1 heavy metal translocating P-type ATPase [Enterococcus dongliensis]MDT2635789.1 heavy metal translocating P-type ATPase [Enterococcus dongliensis]MDT2637798.1 heavy metal translocating P-type ATPase [Enterococcus dongliensis]MDT2645387.1 heavy metal translocating P-type ATPase [Enterococcus dongliensis]MDT2647959.1 heavy metal translocating P-type ATPase [Enterococcus dongliensis]